MRLILDATPLIHLIKAGFSRYFEKLDIELLTTGEILKEIRVDEDLFENAAIRDLIKSGKIKVENPKKLRKTVKGTHIGEVSVISLAEETDSVAVIDDILARAYTKSLDLRAVHSTFLILRALKKKVIGKRRAIDIINRMIDNGWRCDVESYKEILSKIDGIVGSKE
ncbi:MAG: DUF3368 domain-containing protein [Candidatus Hydrothermarchaeales archaeon]